MNKHILSRRIASTNLFNKHGTCQKLQERKKERKKERKQKAQAIILKYKI